MNCLNRLTVRCFYPLSGVNRLTVDRTFQSKVPGIGVVDVFKSLKGNAEQSKSTLIKKTDLEKPLSSADPGSGLAAPQCGTGNTVKNPAQRLHQGSAAGGGGPLLRDPYRLQGSRPEAPETGTHQVSSAHPGVSSSQNQDQRGGGLPTGNRHHGLPGYDRVVDISLQLSNLSTHSLKLVVPGENLDPTDAPPALNSGSVKVPRHPVIAQLKEVFSLPGPDRLAQNVWQPGPRHPPTVGESCDPPPDPQAVNPDLGMKAQRRYVDLVTSGSADGGPQSQHWYDPPFPPRAPYSPGPTGHPDPDPPTETKPAAPQSQVDPLRPVIPDLVSPGWSQSEQNLDPPGSKVQSVRVKPASRFAAAHPLRQKPFVRPLNSGPTVSSSQDHEADPDLSSSTHRTQDQRHLHSTVLLPNPDLFPGPQLRSASAQRNPVQAAGRAGTQRHGSWTSSHLWDLGPGSPGNRSSVSTKTSLFLSTSTCQRETHQARLRNRCPRRPSRLCWSSRHGSLPVRLQSSVWSQRSPGHHQRYPPLC